MSRNVRRRRGHLRVAEPVDIPHTLGEYAGISNIHSGLQEKLGKACFWLMADEMYGIMTRHDTRAEHLGNSNGIYIPVRYVNLRMLTFVEDIDVAKREMVAVPVPNESVAVFSVNQFRTRSNHEDALATGASISDYAEVAVRLGQRVTLLEKDEYDPDSPRWWQGPPSLTIVPPVEETDVS